MPTIEKLACLSEIDSSWSPNPPVIFNPPKHWVMTNMTKYECFGFILLEKIEYDKDDDEIETDMLNDFIKPLLDFNLIKLLSYYKSIIFILLLLL